MAKGRRLLRLRGPAVQQAPAGWHQLACPQRVRPALTASGAQGAGRHQEADDVHPQAAEAEHGRAGRVGRPLRRPLSVELWEQLGMVVQRRPRQRLRQHQHSSGGGGVPAVHQREVQAADKAAGSRILEDGAQLRLRGVCVRVHVLRHGHSPRKGA